MSLVDELDILRQVGEPQNRSTPWGRVETTLLEDLDVKNLQPFIIKKILEYAGIHPETPTNSKFPVFPDSCQEYTWNALVELTTGLFVNIQVNYSNEFTEVVLTVAKTAEKIRQEFPVYSEVWFSRQREERIGALSANFMFVLLKICEFEDSELPRKFNPKSWFYDGNLQQRVFSKISNLLAHMAVNFDDPQKTSPIDTQFMELVISGQYTIEKFNEILLKFDEQSESFEPSKLSADLNILMAEDKSKFSAFIPKILRFLTERPIRLPPANLGCLTRIVNFFKYL